ncbi:ABC transporter permease [Oecophyllibacter saccharovorans]|uniref:ABC transporter permease n=1 Tax=Oecophyllibacter saccharovorans TaxID=2558360 RepID=A0A506UKG9_9PROT|nr:methionine ABC transporter permease [Oecophyllibacter saccharovorans]QDH14975.1 ABC transporter permease [Oecophyllibacter saccharovorans]TPW33816.1 ABC transporter permease [Oecophyllibacter saccharovorans]
MSPLIVKLIWQSTLQTLEMVFASTAIAVAVGLPLAVFLIATGPAKLYRLPVLPRLIGLLVDAARAVPFIILLVVLIPVTRFIAGTSLGTAAAIVPLSIAAIPYFARIAEVALAEVDPGLIDAVRAMGGTRLSIIRSVLLPEAMPGLIGGLTVTLITMVGASAMAGMIGAGGLGDLAIRYGYQRYNTTVMIWVVVVLIVMVCLMQWGGNALARRLRR